MAETAGPSVLVKVPPPAWGALFLLVAWLVGLALPLPFGLAQAPLGVALVLVGLAVAVTAAIGFRRAGTEIEPASPTNRVLIVTGPFRFSRNPMYFGMLVMMVGIALLVGSWPMLLAPIAFFLWVNFISIPFEEEKMARQFGDAYAAYKARVRRWL
jgi:protein-S-isoprenylcysteine O-methyltransferase Ste14